MKKITQIIMLACALASGMMGAEAEGGKSKSGFLLGVGLDTSFGATGGFFTLGEFIGFRSPATATTARLILGGQKYFTPGFGFDIKVRAGTGMLSFGSRSYDYNIRVTSGYSTLSAGAEANLLWDFLNKGKHSMGMSFGVGYDYIKASHIGLSSRTPNPPPADLPTASKLSFGVLTPAIGLHYYSGPHQIAFIYGIGKIMDKLEMMFPPKLFFSSSFSYVYRF